MIQTILTSLVLVILYLVVKLRVTSDALKHAHEAGKKLSGKLCSAKGEMEELQEAGQNLCTIAETYIGIVDETAVLLKDETPPKLVDERGAVKRWKELYETE